VNIKLIGPFPRRKVLNFHFLKDSIRKDEVKQDPFKEELSSTTQNVIECASRSPSPPSPQCFFLTCCSVLDLSENTLEDGQAVLDVLRAMPNIRCLYLKGNPLVSKLPNYRKVGLSSA
jgi:hypothetical protein